MMVIRVGYAILIGAGIAVLGCGSDGGSSSSAAQAKAVVGSDVTMASRAQTVCSATRIPHFRCSPASALPIALTPRQPGTAA
jgi:hypothetical protein